MSGQSVPVCSATNGHLFLARQAATTIVSPATGQEVATLWTPQQTAQLLRDVPLCEWFDTEAWVVTRWSSAQAHHLAVSQRSTGEPLVTLEFPRRIELATSVVSPSSRFTAFIQANNIASELTIVDAATADVRSIAIPHQAPLAAFAIQGVFSPDESCLAVSMERSGGPGPETWLIDLETGQVGTAMPGEVIGWR